MSNSAPNNHVQAEPSHTTVSGPSNRTPQTLAFGNGVQRRFFLKALAVSGAGLAPIAGALAGQGGQGNQGNQNDDHKQGKLSITEGDADILRFLAAAEILETDLWEQYNEFTNVDSAYTDALEGIDDDMPAYVTQNTNDEFSHQDFLNAFLVKMNKKPVNLEPFRTLPSSPVAPVQ